MSDFTRSLKRDAIFWYTLNALVAMGGLGLTGWVGAMGDQEQKEREEKQKTSQKQTYSNTPPVEYSKTYNHSTDSLPIVPEQTYDPDDPKTFSKYASQLWDKSLRDYPGASPNLFNVAYSNDEKNEAIAKKLIEKFNPEGYKKLQQAYTPWNIEGDMKRHRIDGEYVNPEIEE